MLRRMARCIVDRDFLRLPPPFFCARVGALPDRAIAHLRGAPLQPAAAPLARFGTPQLKRALTI